MMWVKIDDRLLTHPKIAPLSDAALALWLRGLVYSASQLTDGHLPPAVIPRLGRQTAVRELAAARLWTATDDRGYLIHDYLRYQPSRATVLAERAFYQSLGRAGAAARWGRKSRFPQARSDGVTPSQIPKPDSATLSQHGGTAWPVFPCTRVPVKREERPPTPDQAATNVDLQKLKAKLAGKVSARRKAEP